MGARGPVPKRETERRRRNKPEDGPVTRGRASSKPRPPAVNRKWHAVARRWYTSLARSGQAEFYEPSDWATAYLIAETISRELNPQPMVVGSGKDAAIEMVSMPPKGASLAAWLKAMSALMVTEGDRRRLRLELERGKDAAVEDEETAAVASMAAWRERLEA